jgi:hypothetical protein
MNAGASIGRDPVSARDLFVASLASTGDVADVLTLPSRYFVCLLAWESTSRSDTEILEFMRTLVKAGCVYLCSWGPGCERVHDLFDEADLERSSEGPFAMSTWHADEPLAEAVWFALFNAYPDDAFFDGCASTIGITIGSAEWAREVRAAFEEKVRPRPASE